MVKRNFLDGFFIVKLIVCALRLFAFFAELLSKNMSLFFVVVVILGPIIVIYGLLS